MYKELCVALTPGDKKRTKSKQAIYWLGIVYGYDKPYPTRFVCLYITCSGIVYGYDKPYPTSRLWENFTADMCEDLAGKPKMFFIQVST